MDEQFSPIFKFLWISRRDMSQEQTSSLIRFCGNKFNIESFSVTKYDKTIEGEDVSDISFEDYDAICVDGFPRYVLALKYKSGLPVFCAKKAGDSYKWTDYTVLADDQAGEILIINNIKENKKFIIAACIVFFLILIPFKIYAQRIEYTSIIEGNLEHELNKAVEVGDITHIKNDIYLARCYTDDMQFNAYLYYDTSTVRIDEGSILHETVR